MEEVVRFVLDKDRETAKIKRLRSAVRKMGKELKIPLMFRNVYKDVGKDSFTKSEAKRISLADIFSASAKRTQEALRVLEEFSKLINSAIAQRFKKLRFDAYNLEQELQNLLNCFE